MQQQVRKFQLYFKRERILVISGILAMISCFLIPPDYDYLTYIDEYTLVLLFSLMAVMAGLKECRLFENIGQGLLKRFHSQRGIAGILIFLCFFSGMFVTNDVALITFVPFGIFVLQMAKMETHLCQIVTLMTIGANLGSMLTPVGNPQNLYLYSFFNVSIGDFLALTFPYVLLAGILLLLSVLLLFKRRQSASPEFDDTVALQKKKLIYYTVLFLLCLFTILDFISIAILLPLIFFAVFLQDRKLLLHVDYGLLATFFFFFIFIGNMGRLPVLHQFIAQFADQYAKLVAIGISQIISNVPAALLLSGFTDHWQALVTGTNLGGLGTLIASMASFISYKQVILYNPALKGRYLVIFTGWNVLFLAIFLWFSC